MLHQIGVGALGPVFRTYEPTRDRLVAVKVFRLDITPEQSRSLADELARAADAGLFHPSIVEPVAAGVEGTAAYRAEEYVAAESLDIALRHYAPALPDKVVPIVAQLAGALDFARAVGIGHGGLHPRDIFVTPDEVRATGFGVVDALEQVGLRAPVRRPYTSPERIAGVTWGTPADVFSLAAIAYELLTGRRPSGTGDQLGSLAGFEHADDVRAVLARAMADDPQERYATALAFAGDLEAATRGRRDSGVSAPAAAMRATAAPAVQTPAEPAPLRTGVPPAPVDDIALAPAVEDAAPPAPEPEDVAAEREEDEAFADFLGREEAPRSGAFDPATRESAGERLAFEAAELSLSETPVQEQFADEFDVTPDQHAREPSTRVPVPPARPEPARDRVEPRRSKADPVFAGHSILGRYDDDRAPDEALSASDPRSSPERIRPVMLPVAIAAIVCLLLGYAVGYLVGSRIATPPAAPAAAVADSMERDEPAVPDPGGEATSAPSAASPVPPSEAPEPADPGPVPQKPAEPQAGRLVIRSTPARASVTVNGEWRGRTPLTLDNLAFGQYVVRVVQPGFEVAREELTLAGGATSHTMDVRLRRQAAAAQPAPPRRAPPAAASPGRSRPAAPASFSGSVYVDSRPRGAKVFIDGKEFGSTPLRVPEITIGSHVVRLELPDHRTWTASVRVTAGEETRVSGSLDPIR